MNKTAVKDTPPYSAWKQTTVSPCETHHLIGDVPFYERRFENVLKFHEPGYAPVKDNTGSYHIDMAGNPIYTHRFYRTFGFYEGYATVVSKEGWFHVLPSGNSAYGERYAWCGNFQEGLCTVRNQKGKYFHINGYGKPIYEQDYYYAGDFKDGIAVVCREDGKSCHINTKGRLLHTYWYAQLDVFHKGFARAKDEQGWFYVKKDGTPASSKRFLNIEPFYNGQAHAEDLEGNLLIIDEEGQVTKEIFRSQRNLVGNLSGDLVGFWRSETIKLALELDLLETLPGSLEEIAAKIQMPGPNLERLLRALWEIGIVEKFGYCWLLTEKGHLLSPKDSSFMASACLMWAQVQKEWLDLKEKLIDKEPFYHPTFKEQATDKKSLEIYRCALKGYAQEDFVDIGSWPMWGQHSTLLGLGQTAITLLAQILEAHPFLKGVILNKNYPLYHIALQDSLKPRLQQVFSELDKPWGLKADAVLLPRFLHYFPDEEACQILRHIFDTLSCQGKLYLFEMILDPLHPRGGLLDLNMLAESGGRLRTFSHWEKLFGRTGFLIENHQSLKPHLDLIVGQKL